MPIKILVVEDEADVAELLERMLGELGLRTVIAADATMADRLLTAEEVDAVTLDLGMPGRGGLAWLESIAASRPELARRTLVITGMPLVSESVERLASCGAGVLAKPFSRQALADAVRAQIAHDADPFHSRN